MPCGFFGGPGACVAIEAHVPDRYLTDVKKLLSLLSEPPAMHLQIVEAGEWLNWRYVVNGSHCGRQCRSDPQKAEPNKGPECWMDCSGLGDATPEYWIDGRQHRPLRRRHSGKGRAVPVRCP
jgi:hypothetical protein